MTKIILAALAVVLTAGLVLAADPALKPKHGGKIAPTGHHLIELVANGRSLEVYVTHVNGEPEDRQRRQGQARPSSPAARVHKFRWARRTAMRSKARANWTSVPARLSS